MRRGHESQILEVRHNVADRRRGQGETGITRQCTRAHRLSVADIALDQRLEQELCPLTERLLAAFCHSTIHITRSKLSGSLEKVACGVFSDGAPFSAGKRRAFGRLPRCRSASPSSSLEKVACGAFSDRA